MPTYLFICPPRLDSGSGKSEGGRSWQLRWSKLRLRDSLSSARHQGTKNPNSSPRQTLNTPGFAIMSGARFKNTVDRLDRPSAYFNGKVWKRHPI